MRSFILIAAQEKNKIKNKKKFPTFYNNYNIFMEIKIFYKDRNETYKDINDNIDYDVINKYIEIYQDFNSEDDWYNQVKVLAEEMGYAPSVKMYKEDPTLYKGHIGDVCEMIRHLLTGRIKTPNLYQLLKIIGIDEFKNRVEFYKN